MRGSLGSGGWPRDCGRCSFTGDLAFTGFLWLLFLPGWFGVLFYFVHRV